VPGSLAQVGGLETGLLVRRTRSTVSNKINRVRIHAPQSILLSADEVIE
jgi:hypothetical protein